MWATHFVAILAFHDDLNVIRYDFPTTMASIVVALAVSGAAFFLVQRNLWLAGLVLGSAIAAMHYTGMAALRVPARLEWNQHYIWASFVLGVAGSMAAFWINAQSRDISHRLSAATLLTLAIAGLHFTGMTAVTLHFDPRIVASGSIVDATWVSAVIGVVMISIIVLGGVGAGVDQMLAQRDSRERDRLKTHVRALQSAQEQLSVTASNLQEALIAANEASGAKTKFLAMMSHELRTPLNAIIGFSDLMRRKTLGAIDNPDYVEYIDIIHQSGEHLLAVVNDVLDMAKLDNGHLELEMTAIDVVDLVGRSIRMVEATATTGEITLDKTIEPNLPLLRADERRLQQVLLNLLTNAIKFTPPRGKVNVTVSHTGSDLTIAVADTGVGIPADKIVAAMAFFGQVDNVMARKHQGAGIGLPLSKQMVELQGGSLALTSELGRGTTVTVTFPADQLVSDAPDGEAAYRAQAHVIA